MIYFDSLKNDPDPLIIDAFRTFIENESEKTVEWSEWRLYIPRDVPSQIMNGRVGGDCGVHICSWGLIIYLSSYSPFEQKHMGDARKAIANILLAADPAPVTKTKQKKSHMLTDGEQKLLEIRHFDDELIVVQEAPLNFVSTFEFCGCLKYLQPDRFERRQRTAKT
ncbi:hypothetical protein QAD02_013721 [Eretmocerus hayati]|uniref:Uncharacterized protein n=1 Tax=Eretmocerus hayati TaxID=131215 RepID=A0ACC2P2X9_9HYME|nr:hypothetical protein QAD02_013721 [Eretmocerus hayati]